MPLPDHHDHRPSPEAMTRQELAEELGVSYQRIYYWTAQPKRRRAQGIVPPSWTTRSGRRTYDWFSIEDLDDLRAILGAIDRTRMQIRRRRGS